MNQLETKHNSGRVHSIFNPTVNTTLLGNRVYSRSITGISKAGKRRAPIDGEKRKLSSIFSDIIKDKRGA